jgi:high-affinity iron transporter
VAVKADTVLSTDDFTKLMQSSAEQVAHGKALFDTNCAVCHGPGGQGDGVGGAALNPKPRNFHGPVSAWTNGDSVKAMYVTLTFGVPGTGMASYKALPPQDRLALIHFLHTWTPEVEAASKADAKFADAMKEDGIGGGGGNGGRPKVALPIDFAIDRVVHD